MNHLLSRTTLRHIYKYIVFKGRGYFENLLVFSTPPFDFSYDRRWCECDSRGFSSRKTMVTRTLRLNHYRLSYYHHVSRIWKHNRLSPTTTWPPHRSEYRVLLFLLLLLLLLSLSLSSVSSSRRLRKEKWEKTTAFTGVLRVIHPRRHDDCRSHYALIDGHRGTRPRGDLILDDPSFMIISFPVAYLGVGFEARA